MSGAWQPYYVAFATAYGRTPEQQAEATSNVDFMVWMSGRWAAWMAETGVSIDRLAPADHEAFGVWLAASVAERAVA